MLLAWICSRLCTASCTCPHLSCRTHCGAGIPGSSCIVAGSHVMDSLPFLTTADKYLARCDHTDHNASSACRAHRSHDLFRTRGICLAFSGAHKSQSLRIACNGLHECRVHTSRGSGQSQEPCGALRYWLALPAVLHLLQCTLVPPMWSIQSTLGEGC